MATDADAKFMCIALDLAEQGRGKTSPNPMVGAVLVKNGREIARGYHRAVGKEHAEVMAIREAKTGARGATLYVSLEPCCHTGRTGPCTEAIIEAGIKTVVLPLIDPNPLVNGKGIKRLRQAGIKVITGLLKQEAWLLNDTYMGYHEKKRPFVTLKLAQTLDGRIATVSGDSRWISGAASRRLVHQVRAESDAVVVGAETVRTDNPVLTVRLVKGKNPYRIILSNSLQFLPRTNLLDKNDDFKTILATSAEAMERFSKSRRGRNLIYWTLKKDRQGRIDLRDFLKKAHEFGLHSLLVEGGSSLATSFLRAGLVDKLMMFTVPAILGKGIDSIQDLGINRLAKAIKFDFPRFVQHDTDCLFVGYPKGRR